MRYFLTFALFVFSFPSSALEKITLAGGCFWCMEPPFEKLDGVKSVVSGFSGGKGPATYKQVASGKTLHREVVQVSFDPAKIPLEKIIRIFFRNINPTDDGGQFVDRGRQYSPALYFHSAEQKQVAQKVIKELEAAKKFDGPIKVPLEAFKSFFPAEDYHQDYYKRNPVRYKYYRWNSGRDQYLDKIWGKKA